MSIVIVGGNECMKGKYKSICKEYDFDAKIFVDPESRLHSSFGNPDLIVLFTNPVSHTMAKAARNKAAQGNITLVQSHCGSGNALRGILEKHVGI